MKTLNLFGLITSFVLAGAIAVPAIAHPEPDVVATSTKELFLKADPNLAHYFDTCDGYVVFPNIGKAAVGLGFTDGRGLVFEHGHLAGEAKLTQVTVGLQFGGINYAEVIFFETPQAFKDFCDGKLTLSAGLTAVAAKAGGSNNAKYENGVLIYSTGYNGLMFEASVGGQKFKFIPLQSEPAHTATEKPQHHHVG